MLNTLERHSLKKAAPVVISTRRWTGDLLHELGEFVLVDSDGSSRFDADETIDVRNAFDWAPTFLGHSNHLRVGNLSAFYSCEATSPVGRTLPSILTLVVPDNIWGRSSGLGITCPAAASHSGAFSRTQLHQHLLLDSLSLGSLESTQTVQSFSDASLAIQPAFDLWKPDLSTRVAFKLAEIPNMRHAQDSLFPNDRVIAAVQQLVGYLPAYSVLPEIEIDDSVGSISLVWRGKSNANVFSLEVPNGRSVLGVGVGPEFSAFKPWKHSVLDERKIMFEIEQHRAIKKLLSGV